MEAPAENGNTEICIFILSFTFVVVSGLFEWKRICARFFYRFFIHVYVLLLGIQLSKGEGLDPINQFNPATCLCLSQPGPAVPTAYVVFFFLCSVSSGEKRGACLLILAELITITV